MLLWHRLSLFLAIWVSPRICEHYRPFESGPFFLLIFSYFSDQSGNESAALDIHFFYVAHCGGVLTTFIHLKKALFPANSLTTHIALRKKVLQICHDMKDIWLGTVPLCPSHPPKAFFVIDSFFLSASMRLLALLALHLLLLLLLLFLVAKMFSPGKACKG